MMKALIRKRYLVVILCCGLSALVSRAPGQQPQATMSPEEAFAQLAKYDDGQNNRALKAVEAYVADASGKPDAGRAAAKRLAAVLDDAQASPAAKRFALKQLRFVGGEAQAPGLAKLLGDPKLGELARTALETIPDEAAGQALRDALNTLKGQPLVGAINSLGARRDARAVDSLAPLLESRDASEAAALRALGEIGTKEAAELLQRALPSDALAVPTLVDSRLRCSERLAEAGQKDQAALLYKMAYHSDGAAGMRLPALRGLTQVEWRTALPLALETLDSKDAKLRGGAARLTLRMPGDDVTRALAERLAQLDAAGRVMLLGVLEERGDPLAGAEVKKLVAAEDEAVRAAALSALGRLGGIGAIPLLAEKAATEKGAAQAAARRGLRRMTGSKVDGGMLQALAESKDSAARAELISAVGDRQIAAAAPTLLKTLEDEDAGVRRAAWAGLGELAGAEHYPELVKRLAAAQAPERSAAQKAVLVAGQRVPDEARRLAPVVEALDASAAEAKPALLAVLAGGGGAQALEALRPYLKSGDAAERDAAVRALADWPDLAAAEDLLKVAKAAESKTHRVLALRGYLRLAREAKAGRLAMLQRAAQTASGTEEKKQLLAVLGEAPDPGALELAASMLGDASVRDEAALAMLKIGQALLRVDRPAVAEAMTTLLERAKNPQTVAQAKALLTKAESSVELLGSAPYGKQAVDARKKALQAAAPEGAKLVCHLDCGVEAKSAGTGGPSIAQLNGRGWSWPGAARVVSGPPSTAGFDGKVVNFAVAGLDPKKHYALGFSWWDYDNNGRVQSVAATGGKKKKPVTLQAAIRVPAWQGQENKPAEFRLPLAPELCDAGQLRVTFRREGQSNVLVGEVWLLEADKPIAAIVPAAAPDAKAAAKPATQPTYNSTVKRSGRSEGTRIIIVTGVDYPGHKWKLTAPVLRELLEKDSRLAVDIVEDPNFLASPKLHDYRAVVLHFMDWEVPSPGEKARGNFVKYLNGGKGLVLIHFACGAFQDWPEFKKIAGGTWNPKTRGHDPRGPFRVEITQEYGRKLLAGLKAFDTDDELYTCLDLHCPIGVAAEAKSKVDKKDYPMAFTLNYGDSAVFHTLLGHDVKAFQQPGAAELMRRGTAWAAGLEPTAAPK